MKFGVFDHLDHGGGSTGELFEERLRLAELYDRHGFYGYHLAEHHGTPLGYAPSPSLFLAAMAQRTRRLRIGPLVYLLPLYHPLRLIEEVCMLDQLSGGRLMLGIGRGVSPVEVGFFRIPPEEQLGRFEETLAILLAGLQAESLDHQGRYFRFDDVPMTLRPVQHPYPELWYGVSSPESTMWAARNGINIVSLSPIDKIAVTADIYRQTWAEANRADATMPLIGASRHIVVAETDAEARRIAATAYRRWHEHLMKLWIERAGRTGTIAGYPVEWEGVEAAGSGCAGSPETVRRYIEDQQRRGGISYLASSFAFGDMRFEDTARSVELFAQEVMPALTDASLEPAAVEPQH